MNDLREIDIVFDGPPDHDMPRLIEVLDGPTGLSMNVGEWVPREDGTWALRLWISSRASVNAG